ncbi:xin actin-binding repeat-containing protein 1-like [Nerophis lumbriciformis]|uniref:xin actin-binding repeat-containing protein 1-like n=1 Tax=Nerophis lumbriciformis TaxID=546530 RepID=UPI002ADF3B3D|nr:xin actin-binding repeat-containing protein 1-like [Nerophis lumbriciformis]
MERKYKATRSQSLRSLSASCDEAARTDTKLLSRAVSVSQLVSRYQDNADGNTPAEAALEKKSERNQRSSVKQTTVTLRKKPELEPPKSRNHERRQERSEAKTTLYRSKSMGSLQNKTESIEDLKARFESMAPQKELKSEVKAMDIRRPSREVKPVKTGKMEAVKKEQKPPRASLNDARSDAMKDKAPKQVVSRTERRKTIGGSGLERPAASKADEKRRSIADFRENLFLPEKEKLCVSVKALSALYLSKVATQEAEQTILKPAQDQAPEPQRRVTRMRMAEDTQLNRDDQLGHQLETQPQRFSQSQTPKETLSQQRQKCELRRLLKHTHPELKMLDEVVDEELAEVLNSDSEVTADQSGYEGEVRSRRLIFENSSRSDKVSSYNPRMHMAEETLEKGNVRKTSAVLEDSNERSSLAQPILDSDQRLSSSPEPNRECEEEPMRIDVQATRRMFESQCVETSQPNSDSKHGRKVSNSGDAMALIQGQQAQKCEPCNTRRDGDVSTQFEGKEDSIKTKSALMQNNPFMSQNIKEHSHFHTSPAAEDDVYAIVKDRAHLFESMPFDRIRRQNKDEIETMVETLKESLQSLHRFNVIHVDGSIIEVNETTRAKKAEYTISGSRPEINYEEVSEGNFQNFILRVLPRANLKPQVTYLKEACDGEIKSSLLIVPVNQHQECKTANVLQFIEDVLNQDNSLRKGVIIQEDNKSEDIIVYSLYKYSDEEDVRQYCPPQAHCSEINTRKSPVVSPDRTCQVSSHPAVKGNVKLFRSCIEKGELEYLKTLQASPTVEELTTEQIVEIQPEHADEGAQEWAPVDVKKLRSMFSGGQKPSQPSQYTDGITISPRLNVTPETAVDVPPREDMKCSTKAHEEVKDSVSLSQFDTQYGDTVLLAELVEVVDNNEMSNLQTAIHSLQQATTEARSLHKSSQEKQKPIEQPVDVNSQKIHSEQNTLPKDCGQSEQAVFSINSASDSTACLKDGASEEIHRVEDVQECHFHPAVVPPDVSETSTQQEGEENVFQGKLKAALDSLERSNINVSKGDFRAAMIYRNSSKPSQERLKTDAVSGEKTVDQDVCVPSSHLSQNTVREEGINTTNAESTSKGKFATSVSEKSRRNVGPKPGIPPKPEHLKAKEHKQSNTEKHTTKLLKGETTINTDQPEEDLSKRKTVMVFEQDIVGQERPHATETNSQTCQEIDKEQPIQVTMEKDHKEEINVTQDIPVGDKSNDSEEIHLDFNEACQMFGGKKAPSKKKPPVKPKRVKLAQPHNKDPEDLSEVKQVDVQSQPTLLNQSHGNPPGQKDEPKPKQDVKVAMRQKKGRTETEDERRQRLSVHMDEIMRGNISAATEIFDNLRKQEELQSILCRVEEIEEDTSKVDVRSLRKVFEDVPDWVVRSNKKKEKPVKKELKGETLTLSDNKSPMAHVFGDLERASEEIMNLKEQTLARLVDIEDAIKKALYSVSTLKSDSDIAGLSCLFKESLGSMQGSSANISKISIGSSKTKPLQEQEVPTAPTGGQNLERTPQCTSSPAFISIQSAARKPPVAALCPTCQHSQRPEETFCTTKVLQCNSPGLYRKKDDSKESNSPPREISLLEVHTDLHGSTKAITENYERTDACGTRIYSSKTSAVVTTPPESVASSTAPVVVMPAMCQIATYPEIPLPSNDHKQS